MMEILNDLLKTDPNWVYTLCRLISGIIIFPYGMQKLLGWFDDFGGGVGIRQSLASFKSKKIPTVIAWLVIIGQSFGSIMLVVGLFSRFAATANFIIFVGALLSHRKDGWTMNWVGTKKGEGIEYFILLLTLLVVVVFKGGGMFSVDFLLWQIWR